MPVDASEARKDPPLRDYHFGHHDADRLKFTRGRHVMLEPNRQGPPRIRSVDPYAEVVGKLHGAVGHQVTSADFMAARDRLILSRRNAMTSFVPFAPSS